MYIFTFLRERLRFPTDIDCVKLFDVWKIAGSFFLVNNSLSQARRDLITDLWLV